jgi:hypothetical protein
VAESWLQLQNKRKMNGADPQHLPFAFFSSREGTAEIMKIAFD